MPIDPKDKPLDDPDYWGVLNPGTKAQWQAIQNADNNQILKSMVEGTSKWKGSGPGSFKTKGAQTGRMAAVHNHTHEPDDSDPLSTKYDKAVPVMKEWIAEEVAKQLKENLQEAVGWLISELEQAHQTIDDLECDMAVAKNSWGFKDPNIQPKYNSGSYRNKQFGEE